MGCKLRLPDSDVVDRVPFCSRLLWMFTVGLLMDVAKPPEVVLVPPSSSMLTRSL